VERISLSQEAPFRVDKSSKQMFGGLESMVRETERVVDKKSVINNCLKFVMIKILG
jgi:hypothetical protein